MSASKPPLVLLFPAIFAVPFVLSTVAQAQEKTAPNAPAPAALTSPAKPASTIAPRQSLPAFTSIKASVAPVLALPVAGAPLTPPVPVTVVAPAKTAVKEAALPAPAKKPVGAPIGGAWSAREDSVLATPSPVAATPRVSAPRQRRAFAAAVSLSTAPLSNVASATPPVQPSVQLPVQLTPRIAPAATLAPIGALATLPKIADGAAPVARPSALASREAKARDIALMRLDAQLAGAEARLDTAQSRLTEGQRQLGNVNQLLQSAMLSSGGSGLHPFVRVAERYLGTPYVWGGESARGFDCSGFIMRVMRDLGYKALPHSAAEQFNYGKPIAKNLLQPGDIVFFANTYKPGISHVGIYLGGGRFIHAANSQVGTIVSNLNSAKWVAHYAGARRLVQAS